MSRKAYLELFIDGFNVTDHIERDALTFSYTDNSGQSADGQPEVDDISITIQNRDKKWLEHWFPQEGDRIDARIITEDWTGILDAGSFVLDKVSMSGWPHTVNIGGLAMPADTEFSGAERSRSWSGATMREIAESIAANCKMPLLYQAQYNPVLEFVSQARESDKVFLYNLCRKYGLTVKLFSSHIVIYDMEQLEQGKPVAVLFQETMLSYSLESTITNTGYSACVACYTNADGKLLEYEYRISGKTNKVYRYSTPLGSLGEAQRVAKAKLRELNLGEVSLSCSVPGNTNLVAGSCVSLGGFGNYDGTYLIDKATHDVGDGYTTTLQAHRVMQT